MKFFTIVIDKSIGNVIVFDESNNEVVGITNIDVEFRMSGPNDPGINKVQIERATLKGDGSAKVDFKTAQLESEMIEGAVKELFVRCAFGVSVRFTSDDFK